MERNVLIHYMKLVKFLGTTLGPDYEVILHDLQDAGSSIIAIANGNISGRTLGDPLPVDIKKMLEEKVFDQNDYLDNYKSSANNNKTVLRSSTFCVKGSSGEPELLLCINFTDYRYQDLSDQLLKLRHPDFFVETNFVYNEEKALKELDINQTSGIYDSIPSAIEDILEQVLSLTDVPASRLTMTEKQKIIAILKERGVFQLKNAVKQVAKELHCSQASIYRYINKAD